MSVRAAERYVRQIRKGEVDPDILRKMPIRIEMPGPVLTPQEERTAFEIMRHCHPAVRLTVQDSASQNADSGSRGLRLGSMEILSLPKGLLVPAFKLLQPSQVKCMHCHERTEVRLGSLDFSLCKEDLFDLEKALQVAVSKIASFRQHRRQRHDLIQYSQPRLHPLEILSGFLIATPGFRKNSEQGMITGNLAGDYLRRYWRLVFRRNMPESPGEITRDEIALMWAHDDRRPGRPVVVELVWRAVKAAKGGI
jgi:hypothetical protein